MRAHAVTPDRLVELGTTYRRAKVLLSAIELDVFTVLAAGPLDAETLTRSLKLHGRGARDFFDALVALDLLERSPDDLYANTPEAETYLNRREPTFLGGM